MMFECHTHTHLLHPWQHLRRPRHDLRENCRQRHVPRGEEHGVGELHVVQYGLVKQDHRAGYADPEDDVYIRRVRHRWRRMNGCIVVVRRAGEYGGEWARGRDEGSSDGEPLHSNSGVRCYGPISKIGHK